MPARRFELLVWASVLAIAGCAPATPTVPTGTAQVQSLGALVALDGRAYVPESVLSHNASALIHQDGAGIVSAGAGNFGLLALDRAALADALAYLTTPDEDFYRSAGKAVVTTTDTDGRFHFAVGVPRKQPVIVSVILPGNRRVVGYTIPDLGENELDVSVASTYVTEFLRQRAALDGKSMADYALGRLPDLTARTAAALDDGSLAIADLGIGQIPDLDQIYATAVGKNMHGLGDAWAALLGHRVLAIETLAGSGVSDYAGDGGPATRAAFYRLKGVCVDAAGLIYLADEGNHAVRRLDPATGVVTTIAGTGVRGYAGDGGPATAAQLCFPRSVTLDAAENLYVFDSQNCRVRRVDKLTGVITTIAGNPLPAANGLWTGGFAGDGGPAVKAQLFSPRNGAFDSRGNLYVGDGLKGTTFNLIRKIDPAGKISTFAGIPNVAAGFAGEDAQADKSQLNYTNQLFMAPGDVMYVADTNNEVIRRIDLATNLITTVAGVPGKKADAPAADGTLATSARLGDPYGVAVDAQGQIFISERGFNRVVVVRPDHKLYRVAGGGTQGDGDAALASFDEPHDLAFDHDGNLLVADARAAKLRRVWTRFGF